MKFTTMLSATLPRHVDNFNIFQKVGVPLIGIRIPVDNSLNSRLSQCLGTVFARLMGDVRCSTFEIVAVRVQHGIEFRMAGSDAPSGIVDEATYVFTMIMAVYGSVITCRQNVLFLYDDTPYVQPWTCRTGGNLLGDVQEVLVPTFSCHSSTLLIKMPVQMMMYQAGSRMKLFTHAL